MFNAYAADYALLALGLGLLAVAARHAVANHAPPGWLAAILLLPLAGPLWYLGWFLWDSMRERAVDEGRAKPLAAGELRRRADDIEASRAEGIKLPAETLELARLRFKLGDDAQAADLAREYLEDFPGEGLPSYLLGRALLNQGKHREAIVPLQDAAQADPRQDSGGPFAALAKAFEGAGDRQRARLAWEEAISRFETPESLFEAGRLAEEDGDLREAWKLYGRARENARLAVGSRRRAERRWETAASRAMGSLRARLEQEEQDK